jgi:hypothetical protein
VAAQPARPAQLCQAARAGGPPQAPQAHAGPAPGRAPGPASTLHRRPPRPCTRPQAEFHWWVNLLADQTPTVVDKAAASEGNTPQAKRRAAAFGAAFRAHMAKLRDAPGAYGQTGLFELLELREECLREFGFRDVYRCAASVVGCGCV